MTRVLPLPGPARIRTGPSVVVTASCCGSLSPANKSDCSNIITLHKKKVKAKMGLKRVLITVQLKWRCYCTIHEMRRYIKKGRFRRASMRVYITLLRVIYSKTGGANARSECLYRKCKPSASGFYL